MKQFTPVLVTRWKSDRKLPDLKIVTLVDRVFTVSLNLAYGSYSDFAKFIYDEFKVEDPKGNAEEHPEGMYVSFVSEGVRWHWLLITEMEFTCKDYGTIVHELHHFVHNSIEGKGVIYSKDSEEAFAYVQGYFMDLVIRAFVELKRTTKRKRK